MDPEVAKQLITVGGTLGGALVGVLGGWLVARANIAGQRAIADDNARRERRHQRVKGLLDIANTRAYEWYLVYNSVTKGDGTEAVEIASRLNRDRHPIADWSWRGADRAF